MASKIVEHTGWAGRGPIKETGNKIWRDPTRRRARGEEEEHNITTASNHENWNVFWFNYANWNVQKQRLRNSRDGRLMLLVLASPYAAISKWITDVGTTAISKLTKSAPWLATGLVVIVVRFVAKTQQPGTMRRNESMTDSQWRQCELYQRQTRVHCIRFQDLEHFLPRDLFLSQQIPGPRLIIHCVHIVDDDSDNRWFAHPRWVGNESGPYWRVRDGLILQLVREFARSGVSQPVGLSSLYLRDNSNERISRFWLRSNS